MTKAAQFDAYERMPAHRIPRCPNCQLILPCRNDGKYGPCDARDVSHESMRAIYDLIRAVFEEPHNPLHDIDNAADEAERREAIAAARNSSPRVVGMCKNGHEQTPENVYEGLRAGKYRRWCAVCQKEAYRRKQDDKRRAKTDQGNLTSSGTSEPLCVT